jgi:hypothetical protein
LYSQAKTLTWPPVVTNPGFIGAESNPTGNPIGGFYGYNRIVNIYSISKLSTDFDVFN